MINDDSIQSMGGEARKNALSPERRSEIARDAAEARWLPKAIYGTPENKLKIGERELECYVLEGGRRVLSGRGMQEALGLGQSHGGLLREFLEQESIKPYISNELAMELSIPLRFIRPGRGGIPAVAFDALILPMLCDAVLEARKQSKRFSKRQAEIAEQCEIITRVLAKVGIIALVDEVTGYQEVRNKEALQALLDAFLQREFAAWAKRFPDEFYKQIFRLRGWAWNRLSVKRPVLVGKLTNDIVYERLAPGVLAELEHRNPKDERGRRKATHHQWLTEDVGHPALAQHLHAVIGLMRASADWKQFHALIDKAFPKKRDVLQLEFIED